MSVDIEKVAATVEAFMEYAEMMGMTWGDSIAAVEHLHIRTVAGRFGGNLDAVAEYMRNYGPAACSAIRSGKVGFDSDGEIVRATSH